MKYRIELSGRGGEVVLGNVKKEFYDFVEENNIDFEEYASDWGFFDEYDIDIPEDIRPFEPGDWYEGDDIAHGCGPAIDDCYVSVLDGNDNIIYDALTFGAFADLGAECDSGTEIYPTETLDDGDVYYIGQSFEKGLFLVYEIEADSFDPAKLTFITTDYDGWEIVTGAQYDSVDLDDLGELSTVGKGIEFQLIVVENDE